MSLRVLVTACWVGKRFSNFFVGVVLWSHKRITLTIHMDSHTHVCICAYMKTSLQWDSWKKSFVSDIVDAQRPCNSFQCDSFQRWFSVLLKSRWLLVHHHESPNVCFFAESPASWTSTDGELYVNLPHSSCRINVYGRFSKQEQYYLKQPCIVFCNYVIFISLWLGVNSLILVKTVYPQGRFKC